MIGPNTKQISHPRPVDQIAGAEPQREDRD